MHEIPAVLLGFLVYLVVFAALYKYRRECSPRKKHPSMHGYDWGALAFAGILGVLTTMCLVPRKSRAKSFSSLPSMESNLIIMSSSDQLLPQPSTNPFNSEFSHDSSVVADVGGYLRRKGFSGIHQSSDPVSSNAFSSSSLPPGYMAPASLPSSSQSSIGSSFDMRPNPNPDLQDVVQALLTSSSNQ